MGRDLMRIAILMNRVFDGWSPTDTRLGGTEEAVVEWSKRLSQDHDVTVFQNGFVGMDDLVAYVDRNMYPLLAGEFDVTLNHKALDMPVIGRTLYVTTETDADKHDLSQFEAVIWPSQWAKDHIKVNNKTHVVPYGYDPTHIYPQEKIPQTVLYASSPDRGLDDLIDAWPEVAEHHPDAQLIVTYGARLRDIPNAIFMGDVDTETMDELYRTSDIWCHPCNGGELFGITAVKAQAAGCVPVYYNVMALRETVQSGVRSSHDSLAGDLRRTLGDETLKEAIRQELATKTFPTWDESVRQLMLVLESNHE